MSRRLRSTQSGFSLVEALMATVLMGFVLVMLSNVTAQWLPNWNRGMVSVQNEELLQRGLERILADLSAAEYISSESGNGQPFFTGTATSVTFIRPSLGPNTYPGLDIVRIEQRNAQSESTVVRTRARFTPATGDGSALAPQLGDPVAVLRTPYRITFSYAGEDRLWQTAWQNKAHLPRAIRLLVHNTLTGQILPASTVATIHVDASPRGQQGGPPPVKDVPLEGRDSRATLGQQ